MKAWFDWCYKSQQNFIFRIFGSGILSFYFSRFIFLIVFLLIPELNASWNIDANGSYLSDNFSSSSNTEYGLSFYSTEIQMGLDSRGKFFAGLHIHNLAINDNSTTNINLTSMDYGPSLTWYLGEEKYFYLALAYNPIVTATYTTTGSSATWTGTSTYFSFGVAPELGKNIYFGVKLNYVAENYSEVSSGTGSGTNNGSINYTRNVFFPSIVFTYHNK